MIKKIIKRWAESISADLSPVLYLVCLRAALVSGFLISSWPDDTYFDAFDEGTLIHSITWGAAALAASLMCIAGVALKKGSIVSSMSMVLFVLWLYLIVVYLSNGEIALALVESTSALLFSYFYVSVSINRAWGWVPAYAKAYAQSRAEHPAGKGLA